MLTWAKQPFYFATTDKNELLTEMKNSTPQLPQYQTCFCRDDTKGLLSTHTNKTQAGADLLNYLTDLHTYKRSLISLGAFPATWTRIAEASSVS